MSEDIKENEVELGEAFEYTSKLFEDGFRVTVKIEEFRELIHALEYVNQDKDYVLRFPKHAMKQFEIIPKMKDLLDRVEKAIKDKKMRIEKEEKYHVRYSTDGTIKKEEIHNGQG